MSGAIPIVALDVPSADDAMRIARSLGPRCGFYKVGSELFTAAGPGLLRALRDEGADVFLDLKFHDIPNTVARAVRSAARLGARLLTVHGSGGAPMLEAAARAAKEEAGDRCGVLAVTVLTSLEPRVLATAWGRDGEDLAIEDEVLRLAGLAADAGLHGIVCGGAEVAAVRARFGDRLAPLVPGIRMAGGATHDQHRVTTPAAAQRAGARYLILGRAVTAAEDPPAAMDRVLAELRGDP